MDRLPLAGAQYGSLVEDGIRDAELSDVVQQSGAADQLHTIRRQPHCLGNAEGRGCYAKGVAEGEVRLCIDHIGEGLTYLIDLAWLQLLFCPGIEIKDSLPSLFFAIARRTVHPERTAAVKRKRNAN